MKKYFKYLLILFVISNLMISCLKKIGIPDSNTVTVTLAPSGPKFLTTDMTVNPKDSLFFDFNISCPSDMKFVSLQKNGADIIRDTLSSSNKNSYSSVKKIAADSSAGVYTYRIVARNSGGIYLGSKDIVVTVLSDYDFFTYRFLRTPDSSAKVNTCYLGASNGVVYNYTNAAANSTNIDFGMYYDTTGTFTTTNTADDTSFVLYSLNLPQPAVSFFDISSFTKNATLMKKATSPSFASLTSAGALRSAALTNLSSGARNRAVALATGTTVFFKTANGKSGCLNVNFTSGNNASSSTYMNVDVKIER